MQLAPEWYEYIRAFHIMAVIAWMAGMFYLPRLFAYHARATPGSELSETFKVMERRLLRLIINPAMTVVWVLGITMIFYLENDWRPWLWQPWLFVKFILVTLLSGFHGMLSKWRRDFAKDRNTHTYRFYAMANEVPTVLMVGIVIMVKIKPHMWL
jgi:protoporphyrinogen IX oxidase